MPEKNPNWRCAWPPSSDGIWIFTPTRARATRSAWWSKRKNSLDGETADYGRILAAEYNNGGHTYRAVLFHDPSGNPAYYTPEGKSMKKAFLHSPLKFAAPITSHFSASRFHPILKVYRPHLGTDFGAPSGTPVQTIGDGRVIFAGMKGGDGNLVGPRSPPATRRPSPDKLAWPKKNASSAAVGHSGANFHGLK